MVGCNHVLYEYLVLESRVYAIGKRIQVDINVVTFAKNRVYDFFPCRNRHIKYREYVFSKCRSNENAPGFLYFPEEVAAFENGESGPV